MANKFYYWTKKDGSRWRGLKKTDPIEPTKAVRVKWRQVAPKKRKKYWRQIEKKAIILWKGVLHFLARVGYYYSKDFRTHDFKIEGIYMANIEDELKKKVNETINKVFSDYIDDDSAPIRIIFMRVENLYKTDPKLPEDWDPESWELKVS